MRFRHTTLLLPLVLALTACDAEDAIEDVSDAVESVTTGLADYSEPSTGDCTSDDNATLVACTVNAFLDTLTSAQLDAVSYSWADSSSRTVWSNLPTGGVPRNGIAFGSLSDESRTAMMAVAAAALSAQGYSDMLGVMAADDYLDSSGYGSGLYYIAVFGTPGADQDWMLQIGGHHMAHNLTYLSGTAYPTPSHLAAEPKAAFQLESETYAPLLDEEETLLAMYDSLSTSQMTTAYLSQNFSDVVMGPDNGSTTLDDYPDQDGLLVSSLTEEQQALVTAAIAAWVEDFPEEVAERLMAEYTSDSAYAETYISWAGSYLYGVDVDRNGTYMRIDGPRVWIEVACQNGVIIRDETHYHTIYRDKYWDYGNSL